MSVSLNSNRLLPGRDTQTLLIKWIVALLVPIAVFTFIWSGEAIINNVLLGLIAPGSTPYDMPSLIAAAVFIVVFYATVIALAGYLVAADSGRRGMLELWVDVLIFALIPLILVIAFGLIIGLALCAIVWPLYFYVRNLLRKARHYTPPPPLASLKALTTEQKDELMSRAIAGGLWFGIVFAMVWLLADLIFFFTGSLPTLLLIWVAIRTLILPIAGYFLGRLSGVIALRRTISAQVNGGNGTNTARNSTSRRRQLEVLSTTRAREEAKDLVPNDLPLRSAGAQRFYLIVLVAFVVFYPIIDPFLFGFGTRDAWRAMATQAIT